MLKTKIVENVHRVQLLAIALGDRARTGLAGRSRQVVVLATLAGISTIGIVAATIDNTPSASLTTAAANADQQRAQAASQADRSTRDNPAAASNTPQITASGAATLAAPASAAPTPAPTKKPDAVLPEANAPVSSCFGPRWGTMHMGIDFAGKENAPEFAVMGGTVFGAGWNYTGYGISVVIDHHNGYFTHYAHMNKANVVEGQEVQAGDLIGWEGSTGDSTGPHLHFEVWQGLWNQIDPAPWLRDHGLQFDGC